MKPIHILTTAAAMLMAVGVVPANAQLLGGGPAQTCEAALGGDDPSLLPAESGENTCCYVSDEYDWYAENGVVLGSSYQNSLLQTYTAVECPVASPAVPAESLSTFVEGIDDEEDDENSSQ